MSKSSQTEPSLGELSPETIAHARQRELEYENTRKLLKIRHGLHKLNVNYDVWLSNGFTIDTDDTYESVTYQNFVGLMNAAIVERCSSFDPLRLPELKDVATDLDMTVKELVGECYDSTVAVGKPLPSYKDIHVKQLVIAKYKPKTMVIEFAMLMRTPPPERIVLKIVDGGNLIENSVSSKSPTHQTRRRMAMRFSRVTSM